MSMLFLPILRLYESVLDFSDVHDEKCCQYLIREDAFPSYGSVTGDGRDEEYYYERIRGHHRSFPGQIYPLTYHREFNTNRFDTRGKYNVIEICEDFRHFHGLYPKKMDVEHIKKYFKETELNTEELIVIVRDDGDCCEVKIRKQDLYRYLHYTQRALEAVLKTRTAFEKLSNQPPDASQNAPYHRYIHPICIIFYFCFRAYNNFRELYT